MTKKDFEAAVLAYHDLARECIAVDNSSALIVGVCGGIAQEECYTDLMRGQRLRAFFQALDDVKNGRC